MLHTESYRELLKTNHLSQQVFRHPSNVVDGALQEVQHHGVVVKPVVAVFVDQIEPILENVEVLF